MDLKNYDKQDFRFPIESFAKQAFPIVVGMCFLVFPYMFIWGIDEVKNGLSVFFTLWYLIPAIVFGTIMHELTHAFSWIVFGQLKLEEISFGYDSKTFTPYVYCKSALRKVPYLLGVVMPFIFWGFMPYLISLFLNLSWLLFFAIYFMMIGAGDLLFFIKIINVEKGCLIKDDPLQIGGWIYSPKKVSNEDLDALG